ncbi:MAG TPA: hypothetical protein VHP99_11630 [Pyrinomonadaceae bacterium]|nr:hypothetical protein [Pyrinomonadaceae bacterium]
MKVILLPIFLVASAAICFGQSNQTAKPDVSGTWEFDARRSNVAQSKTNSPEQMEITHHDPELVIRRKAIINGLPEERDLTYYTDGRDEKNPTTAWVTTNPGSNSSRPADTQSKTTWSKDKIVTRSASRFFAGATIMDFEIIGELQLSSDGKTLTKTTRTVPLRTVTGNGVFAGGRGTDLKGGLQTDFQMNRMDWPER